MNSNCSLVLYVSARSRKRTVPHSSNPGEFNPTFYSFGYSEGVNYSNPANAVPNSLYGVADFTRRTSSSASTPKWE